MSRHCVRLVASSAEELEAAEATPNTCISGMRFYMSPEYIMKICKQDMIVKFVFTPLKESQ